ncbi:hypothetical protein BDZ89DRAFT_1076731 [Hymenopellis radicata]|nr:hypothetical protein BDZ89DRAFT_1076731 [Hymenopellis radicata]
MTVTLEKTEDPKRKRKAEFVTIDGSRVQEQPRTAYHRVSQAQSCVSAPPYKHQALISVHPQDFHTTRAPISYALRPSTRYYSCT